MARGEALSGNRWPGKSTDSSMRLALPRFGSRDPAMGLGSDPPHGSVAPCALFMGSIFPRAARGATGHARREKYIWTSCLVAWVLSVPCSRLPVFSSNRTPTSKSKSTKDAP
ncbi:hypothetical protein BS50DRAFT_573620 [Corynespora cassiicola Philippines]|uniref:Uncharacterized protein n=1 Tax=Corynespora cassiicola Philippines TaxID=1448308 RepID=A0A2T2NNG6_CORCC|nr:hypothetical protein BS50DRAFT_573620 [Corynespora cassiicola Philippines]